MSATGLFRGSVFHARYGDIRHSFRYPALFIVLPVQDIHALESRWFSINRWNLMSWYERDHGLSQLKGAAWARSVFNAAGISDNTTLYLQTQPRILGFVFNPVSFWLAKNTNDELIAFIAEVNNTFNERHAYLLKRADLAPIEPTDTLTCTKIFHVSPFMPIQGHYAFRISHSAEHFKASIVYHVDAQTQLNTSLEGNPEPLTSKHILRALCLHGWSTVMVVWRIHWQALRLLLRKARFYKKPEPPHQEVSS